MYYQFIEKEHGDKSSLEHYQTPLLPYQCLLLSEAAGNHPSADYHFFIQGKERFYNSLAPLKNLSDINNLLKVLV